MRAHPFDGFGEGFGLQAGIRIQEQQEFSCGRSGREVVSGGESKVPFLAQALHVTIITERSTTVRPSAFWAVEAPRVWRISQTYSKRAGRRSETHSSLRGILVAGNIFLKIPPVG